MKLLPSFKRVEGYDSSYHAILFMKAEQVDLNRIGCIATSLSDFILNDKMESYLYTYMKYGVAQYQLSMGIGIIEPMIMIRELCPYLDLVDGNEKKINHNQWMQRTYLSGDHKNNLREKRDSYSVYQTNKDVYNDEKVILLYGFEFLNGYRVTNVDEIQIWRKHVQLLNKFPIDKKKKHPSFKGVTYDDGKDEIGLLDIEDFGSKVPKSNHSILSNKENLVYHNNMVIFNTPILTSRHDLIDIRFVYPNGDAPCLTKVNEEIKIKGLVFEQMGRSISY